MLMSSDALFERADRALGETRRLLASAKATRLSIATFGMSGIVIAEDLPEDRQSIARRHVTEGERRVATNDLP